MNNEERNIIVDYIDMGDGSLHYIINVNIGKMPRHQALQKMKDAENLRLVKKLQDEGLTYDIVCFRYGDRKQDIIQRNDVGNRSYEMGKNEEVTTKAPKPSPELQAFFDEAKEAELESLGEKLYSQFKKTVEKSLEEPSNAPSPSFLNDVTLGVIDEAD
jgi:hypothetical protein